MIDLITTFDEFLYCVKQANPTPEELAAPIDDFCLGSYSGIPGDERKISVLVQRPASEYVVADTLYSDDGIPISHIENMFDDVTKVTLSEFIEWAKQQCGFDCVDNTNMDKEDGLRAVFVDFEYRLDDIDPDDYDDEARGKFDPEMVK